MPPTGQPFFWPGRPSRKAAPPHPPWTVIHRVITRDYERFMCLCCFTLERIAVGIQNTCSTGGLSRYKELGQKENKGEKVEGQSHALGPEMDPNLALNFSASSTKENNCS